MRGLGREGAREGLGRGRRCEGVRREGAREGLGREGTYSKGIN